MNFPVTGEDLLKLIPQRPPFVLIDTLFHADEKSAETGFTIPEGHILLNNGFFSEPGLIENIAQSAAAMNGYAAMAVGLPVKTGFIASVNNLVINFLPEKGHALRTRIAFTDLVLDFRIVRGEVFDITFGSDRPAASCEMRIFESEAKI